MTSPGDVPRSVLGYEVVDVLAAGSTARVLRATSPTGREVALKRLHPHLWGDADSRAQLHREAEMLRRAAGPGVATLVDVLDDGIELCLVEEIAGDHSVAYLLDAAARGGERVSTERAIGLASTVLATLTRLHATGLVHADINPRNVMRRDRDAILVDFGVAGPPTRGGGPIRGTLAYLAPEQVDGSALPASDVFAVGVMLWELLRIERLRPPREPAAMLSDVATGIAPAVDVGRPDLAELRDAVAAMLATDPDARPDAASARVALGFH